MVRPAARFLRAWIAPILSALVPPAWMLLLATYYSGEASLQSAAMRTAAHAAAAGGVVALLFMFWGMVDRYQAHAALSRLPPTQPEQTRLQTVFGAIWWTAFVLSLPMIQHFTLWSDLLAAHGGLIVTPWTILIGLCVIQFVFGVAQAFAGPRPV